MNILFISYSLCHLSKSSMYSDLVNEFKNKGHNICPIAPSTNRKATKSCLTLENGIEVLRVQTMDIYSRNLIKKGLANILLSYQYKKAFSHFWHARKFDAILVATPSVMFSSFVSYMKCRDNAVVYLMQKDIFPQNAVDLGIIKKNGILYHFFRYNEMKLLKKADYIGCTSPGNIDYMIKHNDFLKSEQCHLLYNSSNILSICDCNLENRIRLNIENKFVVVFGGNMGKPQQLENVLYLAKKCEAYEDVVFLIIGKGTETSRIREQMIAWNICNIIFEDKLDRNEYFFVLSKCNVGLISLHKDFTVPNTPMKLNDYLNAGIPVLASIDRSNDLGMILEENRMGVFAYADNPDDLFEKFKKMYFNEELCREYSKNGKMFCLNNMSTEKAYNIITSKIKC